MTQIETPPDLTPEDNAILDRIWSEQGSKPLNRKNAWLKVAERLESVTNDVHGLCGVIRTLKYEGYISPWRAWLMLRRINKLSQAHQSLFVWPISQEGRKSRIAYCYRQANGHFDMYPGGTAL